MARRYTETKNIDLLQQTLQAYMPGTWDVFHHQHADALVVLYKNKDQVAAYQIAMVELSLAKSDKEIVDAILRKIQGQVIKPENIKKFVIDRLMQ